MKRIINKIEIIMAGGNENPILSLESFLYAMSIIYGVGLRLRQNFYKRNILRSNRLPCVVISVGNLTVGGTGKTPMTMLVAKRIQRLGYKVVVMSRGYKGRAEKNGGIVSDGRTIFMGAETAGDEPYMMAKRLENVPVVVGRNRFKTGMLAAKKFVPDVLVLDDAFQHLRLVRDIDLVLLDCRRPFGNQHILPRGLLREPIDALERSDAFILTRSDLVPRVEKTSLLAKLEGILPGKAIFCTFYVSSIQKVVAGVGGKTGGTNGSLSKCGTASLRGRHVFAFSGLADNQDFLRTVPNFKCVVTGALKFPDHHPYSERDLDNIVQSAKRSKADCLVTTEKDYVRIAHRIAWPMDLAVVGIESAFGDDDQSFNAFLKTRLKELVEKDKK